ncbi:MAG: gamma-glutamyltransferase [Ignavibacteriales bacterium CG_4_9_14_3_um_filter_34_10]|nr:MAG: gamma-glutamyltransferase [Ignavibacteriales bacterium CG_4_9_14_3_um_filter_34_10]
MRIFFKLFFFLSVLVSVSFSASKDPVRAKNGMVVSADKYASEVGVQILKQGGNAIDAAVAVGFALAVTFPGAGNIGGGGFMVIHNSDGTNTTIDYREKAPSKAYRNMFLDQNGNFDINLSTEGWTSSGVPGSVAGLIYALEKYGTMPIEKVIQPAIDLAEKGFPIEYHFASTLNYFHDEFSKIPSTKKIFTKENGEYQECEIFTQKDLAETLKLIRNNGKDGFYKGKIAKLISQQSLNSGGLISEADLENYQPKERKPVNGTYKGYDVISMGPSSSGGVVLIEALNILENFDFKKNEWGSSKYIHTVSEALKYVYADRAEFLGDEDFYSVPKKWLTSKDYAKEIFGKISDISIPSSEIKHGINIKESDQTTHYSIVDKYGNAVSTTTTINSWFGNKIVVDGAGFFMNNEMDDFSSKPGSPNQFGLLGGEANSIQPNKRMLSAMTPTILLKDGKPFLVIGSPGGSTIITTVLQIILNVVDFNMDIQQAIDSPRFHHQWFPDQIDYEKFGFSADVIENLKTRKQNIGNVRSLGRAEGIIVDQTKNLIFGATDSRANGMALGY